MSLCIIWVSICYLNILCKPLFWKYRNTKSFIVNQQMLTNIHSTIRTFFLLSRFFRSSPLSSSASFSPYPATCFQVLPDCAFSCSGVPLRLLPYSLPTNSSSRTLSACPGPGSFPPASLNGPKYSRSNLGIKKTGENAGLSYSQNIINSYFLEMIFPASRRSLKSLASWSSFLAAREKYRENGS